MAGVTETIYTDPDDIARLEQRVRELAVNARVLIRKNDGSVVEGIVAVTPSVMVLRDANDNEGMNGIVKLEDPERLDWSETVWLGDISEVTPMDSVTKGSSKA